MSKPHILATLEDLRAFRNQLDGSIRLLEAMAVGSAAAAPEASTFTAVPDLPVDRRKKQLAAGGKPVRVKRLKTAPLPRDNASVAETATAILVALKKSGRPMRPGELASEMKTNRYKLGLAIDVLVAGRQAVITGKTSGTRVSLPAAPAKEAP